ncbi:MAG: DUF3800 domain-containing protein [Chloroflexi bacterium]|nr:DUF3800 domain-containing protein [Chloroflexota bacterium]
MQYFFVDESGDAGLEGQASSSSHFVVAMVQLPERAPLKPLVELRKALYVPPNFEFKYHQSKPLQKDRFFKEVLAVDFRIRAVTADKARLGPNFNTLNPQALTVELIIGLTMHASELDLANEVLIIDGATPSFCRHLRIQFSERSKRGERIRPFKNIIGGDSKREDGLQLADMIAGAIRLHVMGIASNHFDIISPRLVDLWNLP